MTSPGLQAKHFWSLLMESVLISYSMFIPGCSSSLFCSRSSGDLKERSQQYWRGILKIVSKRGRPTSCHKWVTPVAWNLAWLDCTGLYNLLNNFRLYAANYNLTVGCPAFWHGPADEALRTRWSRNFAGVSSWATGWMWQVLRTGRQNWCRQFTTFRAHTWTRQFAGHSCVLSISLVPFTGSLQACRVHFSSLCTFLGVSLEYSVNPRTARQSPIVPGKSQYIL